MVFFCILSPFFSFMPMNDPKAGVFSWISGVYGWKAGVFCLKSNEYQKRTWWRSFLILVGIDYTYIWFSFIPFTHLFICLIFCLFLVSYSVCSCEGCEGCPFFWLNPSDCPFFSLERKEPKVQGLHYGGYGLGRCAKISENSLRSDSRDFLTLRSVDRLTPPPLGQINGQLKMENWELKVHLARGFTEFICWTSLMRVEAQRAAAACCASSQRDRIKRREAQ